ncbi:MAG: hypothetical protein R3B09_32245 [Nannocystaceae bacterium]
MSDRTSLAGVLEDLRRHFFPNSDHAAGVGRVGQAVAAAARLADNAARPPHHEWRVVLAATVAGLDLEVRREV